MRKVKLLSPMLAAILLCLLLLPGCNGEQEIRVGILAEGLPMCEKTENGVNGFETELAELVAGRMKTHVVYKVMTATELSEALSDGKIDMAMGMTKKSADAEGFICLPYLREKQILCVAKGSGITGLADLSGKRVVVEKDSAADKYLASNPEVKRTFSEVTYTKDIYGALLDTVVADYDGAILTDSLAGYYVTELHTELELLENSIPETAEKRCLVFAASSDRLAEKTEKTLSDLWAEGSISALSVKWFGFDLSNEVGRETDEIIDIN